MPQFLPMRWTEKHELDFDNEKHLCWAKCWPDCQAGLFTRATVQQSQPHHWATLLAAQQCACSASWRTRSITYRGELRSVIKIVFCWTCSPGLMYRLSFQIRWIFLQTDYYWSQWHLLDTMEHYLLQPITSPQKKNKRVHFNWNCNWDIMHVCFIS